MPEPHAETCRYQRAARSPVGIECKHGFDVCPACDPCTCSAGAGDYGRVAEKRAAIATQEAARHA
jgi:hypothetical protein